MESRGSVVLLSPLGFVAPRLVGVLHPRLSKIPGAESGYSGKRGVRIASVSFVRCSPAAASSRQTQPALAMGNRCAWAAVWRSRQRAGHYAAEDGRGKRGGYGAMGDGRRVARRGWCTSRSRCAAGRALERRAARAQRMVAAQGEAMKAARATGNARCSCCALRQCCASYSRCRTGAGLERRIMWRWKRWRRVGGENRGAGDGERVLQVTRT
ncbi:hypothetical protein B0H14DRAFT_1404212 [Mycena olivaceomarginata]|nr:hypothetical protein B0H14DRAFT_1404212 [Mycena olivaceomarginata]